MKPVIRVRGAGGAEFDIDDPRESTDPRSEVYREQIAKGDLVVIEDGPKPAAKKAAPKPADD